MPTAVVTHEACVKAIDFWSRDDFCRAIGTKRPNHMHHEGRLQHGQIIRDRRAADLTGAGEFGSFKDPAALRHEEFGKFLERVTSLQPKEFLHVLRPIGVHPLLEVPFREVFSQEERRQTTVEEAMVEVLSAKIFEVGRGHGREPQLSLASSQRVAKLARSAQRRRTRCYNPGVRVVIGRDLQNFRGTFQPVHLIQHHPTSPYALKKGLRIVQHAPHARQLAVKILNIRKALAQEGFANPPHTGEPDHRALLPRLFETVYPRVSLYHMTSYWLKVTLYTILMVYSIKTRWNASMVPLRRVKLPQHPVVP